MSIPTPHAPPIKASVYVAAPPSAVFRCIATGPGWDEWFTDHAHVDAWPGGKISFSWRNFGVHHENLDDAGQVLVVEPDRRFVFTWHPCGRPTQVAFVLRPLASGTVVEVEESGYSTIPSELEVLVSCAAGWGGALMMLKLWLEHGIRVGPTPSEAGS